MLFVKRILLLVCILSWSSQFCLSDEFSRGEIININYQYLIAFTNLNKDILEVGEILSILEEGQETTIVEVIETSEIMSRLGPIQDDPGMTDFKKINIGNIVMKEPSVHFRKEDVSPSPNKEREGMKRQVSIETQLDTMVEHNKRLVQYLDGLIQERNTLEKDFQQKLQENEVHEQRILILTEKLQILKAKLIYMADIVDRNVLDYAK